MRRAERQVTDTTVIDQMLKSMSTCHVSFNAGEYPYTVPLSYGHSLEDGKLCLYFHCATVGRKIELIKNNPKVSFCISTELGLISGEKACDYSMAYQSVLGIGEIEILSGKHELIDALNKIMLHYDQNIELSYPDAMLGRTTGLKLTVKEFSVKMLPKKQV